MEYVYPDYYRKFACTADRCEDTCCAGWQIMIDEKSLKRYREADTDFKPILHAGINWKEHAFIQKEEDRCYFLNDHNLCDLYTHLGHDSFCKTCRMYPRHIEEFENLREVTLSLSCPEVVQILLQHPEPVTFYRKKTAKEECYENFDYYLFSVLEETREVYYQILQDRSLSISERFLLVLGIAHDLQGRLNKDELFQADQVLKKYQKSSAVSFVKETIKDYMGNVNKVYHDSRFRFSHLYVLERLKTEWELLLIESKTLLYRKGVKGYEKKRARFQSYCMKELSQMDVILEQLAVYFISTYFLGAVYDDKIYHKTATCIAYVSLLYDLFLARFIKNEGMLDLEDISDIIYRFSREIEHSDPNLDQMESHMWFWLT